MQIKEITVYENPKPYLAVLIDNDIHEVHLFKLFEWLFKQDINLDLYSENHDLYGINLYNDLESMGYPIKEKLLIYISTKEYKEKATPIPHNIYPLVLRYYSGNASYKDLIILTAFLGVDLIPPPDITEGDIPPDDEGFTPPF